jgi:hypothetical protein
LHGDDLYLELKPKAESESLKEGDSLLVRIRLKDLRPARFRRQLPPVDVIASLPRLPIRVEKDTVLPGDAIPVAVRRITLNSREEWNKVVVSASAEPEVRVVFVAPEALSTFPYFVASPNSGLFRPMIAISVPSLGADSQIAVGQDYVQKPRGRKAWLLLTPLTVVADIVTFPFQFYLLTLD